MIDVGMRGVTERRLPRGEQAQAVVDGFRPRFGQEPERLQDGYTKTSELAQDYREEVSVRRGDADRNMKVMLAGMGAFIVGVAAAPVVGPALFLVGAGVTGFGMIKSMSASADARELEWVGEQLQHKANLYEQCLEREGYLIAG